MRWFVPVLVMLSVVACGGEFEGEDEEGPDMKPGENCLSCHAGGRAPSFTAAGTVFSSLDAASTAGVSGLTVTFKDEAGATLRQVTTSRAGNFYVQGALASTFTVEVSDGSTVKHMALQSRGDCNSCHTSGNRIHFP